MISLPHDLPQSKYYVYCVCDGPAHRTGRTFLLDRAAQLTASKLEYFFGAFCPVSGSPVTPGGAVPPTPHNGPHTPQT